MAKIVGVRFKNAGKLFYFDPVGLWPNPGDFVVVDTIRGQALGQVITGMREAPEETLEAPLKPILRIATPEDMVHMRENEEFEKRAFDVCFKKIAEHQLEMKLVQAEQTFDNSKLVFYFTANGRVDFRSLVKDLASVFHTRIELRQIGVRDEARMIGGLGPCGLPICCGTFLGDFQPVSIKMAKEQNLSLNPTKISGVCGRLMCCLKFEDDHYIKTRKRMPKLGKDVETPDGFGTVIDLNVLKETVTVRVHRDDSNEIKTYAIEDIVWFKMEKEAERQGNGKPPAVKKREPEAIVVTSDIDGNTEITVIGDEEEPAAVIMEEDAAFVPEPEAEAEIEAEAEAEDAFEPEPLSDEIPENSKSAFDWQEEVAQALRKSNGSKS